jgi:type IV pilus assembly protein PilC
METIKNGIKSALFYPITLIVVTLGIVYFMLTNVVPTFVEMYANMGAKLPGPTQMIVDASNWILNGTNVLKVIGIVAGVIYGHKAMVKYLYPYRKGYSALLLRMPLFGDMIVKSTVARTALLMSNLFAAGIGINEIMRVAASTSTNILFMEAQSRIAEKVQTGVPLSVLFAEESVFPIDLSQLIRVGEQTAGMDEMLESIARYYQEEFEATVKGLTTVIEPLMIVFVGLMVGVLVVALYLPIFSAGDAFK